MKLTKGALGQPKRLQHWLLSVQKTVSAQRFYATLSFQMGRRFAQCGARVLEAI
jgi:hypothetical protein